MLFSNYFIITRYHPVHNVSNFNKKKSTAWWTDIRNNIYVAETEIYSSVTRVYNLKLVLWNRSILSLCVDRMDVLCLLLYLERLRRTLMIRWWKSDRNSSCNVLQWSSVRRSAHLSCISVRLCHQMSVFTRIVTKILVSVWTRPEAALHIKIKVMWRWSVFLFSLTSNRKTSFVADWKRILSELTLTSSAWKMALR